MTVIRVAGEFTLRSRIRRISILQQCGGVSEGYGCDDKTWMLGPMTPPAKSGDDQRIEVQYTFEDEVLIIEHLDDPPEDFGEALARTLAAPNVDDGEKELEAGLGGTTASVQRYRAGLASAAGRWPRRPPSWFGSGQSSAQVVNGGPRPQLMAIHQPGCWLAAHSAGFRRLKTPNSCLRRRGLISGQNR